MTKLEKLYSIIENSKDVGVKLTKDVLHQMEELESRNKSRDGSRCWIKGFCELSLQHKVILKSCHM